jgi:hypothetical protein
MPRKARKSEGGGFSIYISKLHKNMHGNSITISKESLSTLDQMADHVVSQLADAAGRAVKYTKSSTLSVKAAHASTNMILAGKLRRDSTVAAASAVTKAGREC